MKLIIYDTFQDYIDAGANLLDDLCYIKQLGVWYQGGHIKDRHKPGSLKPPVGCGCPPPPCGCEEPKPPVTDFPESCEEVSCGCGHHKHPPLSVIDVGGVKYWTWEGRLLVDCEGNFIPVSGGGDISELKDYIDAYITSILSNYVRFNELTELLNSKVSKADLSILRIDGNTHNLDSREIIEFCTCECGHIEPTVEYTVTVSAPNCTTNNPATKVLAGSNYSITITPNTGYNISSRSCMMGDTPITISGNTINIQNVTGNIVITFNTTASTYTITKETINCTISGNNSVLAGNPFVGTVTPYSNCHITSVYYLMNGTRIDLGTSPNINIPSVTGNVVIYATAAQDSPTPGDSFTIYYAADDRGSDFSLPSDVGSYSTNSVVTGNTVDFTVTFTKVPVWIRVWIPADKGDLSGYILSQYCDQPLISDSLLHKVGSTTISGTSYYVYDAYNLTNDARVVVTKSYAIGVADSCKIKNN